jgi:hypothetical protein
MAAGCGRALIAAKAQSFISLCRPRSRSHRLWLPKALLRLLIFPILNGRGIGDTRCVSRLVSRLHGQAQRDGTDLCVGISCRTSQGSLVIVSGQEFRSDLCISSITCGFTITPELVKRVGFEQIECPKCGAKFQPAERERN